MAIPKGIPLVFLHFFLGETAREYWGSEEILGVYQETTKLTEY